MVEDAHGSLVPLDFNHLHRFVPELNRFSQTIHSISFEKLIDSSDVNIESWQQMGKLVLDHYNQYDGFVILHGTDTMSYSAAALSFMLKNLSKPVIFTGSQLPIGKIRTDGKENLLTAIEIAAAMQDGVAMVQEVCVYFQSQLFRGNRTHKYNTETFDAFESANFPPLAEAGIHIFYHANLLLRPDGPFTFRSRFDDRVGILKIFPGITPVVVQSILNAQGIRAIVLESFGSGNGPTAPWFIEALADAVEQGLIILNVSQCNKGFVEQGKYDTSAAFEKIGVIGGGDITSEAALVKLMYLLGQEMTVDEVKRYLRLSIRGEMSDLNEQLLD
jgi:L-asparaginase